MYVTSQISKLTVTAHACTGDFGGRANAMPTPAQSLLKLDVNRRNRPSFVSNLSTGIRGCLPLLRQKWISFINRRTSVEWSRKDSGHYSSYFPTTVVVVGNIILFYLLFYSILTGMLAVCLSVHRATLPDVLSKMPKFSDIHTMGN